MDWELWTGYNPLGVIGSTNSGKYDSQPSEDVFDGGKVTGYEYNYDYDYRDHRWLSIT